MPKKVTIHDVASKAGLSVASVSRALSGARPVTPEVAEKVRVAAQTLGYEPNRLARYLRQGRTSSVGLVVPDLGSPFFPALAQGLERALDTHKLSMIVMNADNDPGREARCIEELINRRIDALLISPTHRVESAAAVEHAAARLPVIQIDRYASSRVPAVVTDAEATITLAYEHMLDVGAESFAFIGAESTSSVAAERLREYSRQMRQKSPGSEGRIMVGEFSFDWGHTAGTRIAREWPGVDGIICANDLIAFGVIQGLKDSGINVPHRVMVTGCDDTFFSRVGRPSVTSVAQPISEIALRAVEYLIRGDATAARHKLAPELRARESTVGRQRAE